MFSRALLLAVLSLLLLAGARAQDPVLGYTVDSDETDHLWAIDLRSGEAADLGPTGFSDLEGLCFAPDGRLFAIDDQSEQLVVLDLETGAGTVIGAIGVTIQDAGLSFDAAGGLWLADEVGHKLYPLDPVTGAAGPAIDLGEFAVTGLTAMGSYLYALLTEPVDGIAIARAGKGRFELVGPLRNVLVSEGGLAFDPRGTLWLLEDDGVIATVDLLTGTATTVAQTLSGCEGLAIPLRQASAYSVDSDGSDHLWRVDLHTGSTFDIGPTGFPSIEALCFSPEGVLYGVDDQLQQLVRIDCSTGAGTAVGALGVVVGNPGLSFDGAGTLWLAADTLYSVDTGTGAATAVGPIGVFLNGLAGRGDRLLGISTGSSLYAIDRTTGAGTLLGSLVNASGVRGGLSFAPDGSLWGYANTGGLLYTVGPDTGRAVLSARTREDFESLAIAPAPVGEFAHLPSAASLEFDWSVRLQDRFSIRGRLPDAGLFPDLGGARLRVALNGVELTTGPVFLDERGTFRSSLGAVPQLTARVDPRDGDYSLAFEGLDLRGGSPLRSNDGAGAFAFDVAIELEGAGLLRPRLETRVPFDFVSREAETLSARLAKRTRVLNGAFLVEKLRAKAEAGGGVSISLRATLLGNGGGPLVPADDPTRVGDLVLRLGGATIELPFAVLALRGEGVGLSFGLDRSAEPVPGLRKFAYANAKGRLDLQAEGLVGSGLPASGPGAPTSFLLPIELEVTTAGGVERFRTTATLTRSSELSTSWK